MSFLKIDNREKDLIQYYEQKGINIKKENLNVGDIQIINDESKNEVNDIKWVSSIMLIITMVLTSANIFPINLYIGLFGMAGWLVVGLLWHDRALIVLNAVSLAIYSMGIINYYYG